MTISRMKPAAILFLASSSASMADIVVTCPWGSNFGDYTLDASGQYVWCDPEGGLVPHVFLYAVIFTRKFYLFLDLFSSWMVIVAGIASAIIGVNIAERPATRTLVYKRGVLVETRDQSAIVGSAITRRGAIFGQFLKLLGVILVFFGILTAVYG